MFSHVQRRAYACIVHCQAALTHVRPGQYCLISLSTIIQLGAAWEKTQKLTKLAKLGGY